MKKSLVLLLAGFLSSGQLRAQFTFGAPLSTQLQVTGGNVGIGVANPLFSLAINGNENQTVLGGNTKSVLRIMNNYADAFGRRSEIQFSLNQNADQLLAVIAAEYSSYGSDIGGDLVFGTTPSTSLAMYERMRINRDGNVGIGTTSPVARLHVHDDTALPQALNSSQLLSRVSGRGYNFFMNSQWIVRDAGTTTGWTTTRWHDGISIDDSFQQPRVDTKTWWERDPYDNIQSWGNGSETYLTINQGNVGIGSANPTQKLTVNGTIYSKEVKVDLSVPGPDYVFEETYNLPSLTDTENYIKQNKHLPEVPSACEMEEKGINLSEMNMLLLKKVEELTLYMIELKKENEEIKKLINEK